jgi:hypothetical protein
LRDDCVVRADLLKGLVTRARGDPNVRRRRIAVLQDTLSDNAAIPGRTASADVGFGRSIPFP